MKKTVLGISTFAIILLSTVMMNFSLIYASENSDKQVCIGGVVLCTGDYTTNGNTKKSGTPPSTGYAYYDNGVLTLNNFNWSNEGRLVTSNTCAAIIAENDLIINLVGNNRIVTLKPRQLTHLYGLYAKNSNLEFEGDGALTVENASVVSGNNIAISCATLTLNGGEITAMSKQYTSYGVVYDSLVINRGTLISQGYDYALKQRSGNNLLTSLVNNGCSIVASTKYDGITTENYTATTTKEEHKTYKYIKMVAPTYNVSFDTNGYGTTPESVKNISYGDKILVPTAPTDENYKFVGWYKERSCQNPWDFESDVVTKNTILYAKWEEKKTISINENVQNYVYDTEAQTFEIKGTDATLSGYIVEYKINDVYSSQKPIYAGSYNVRITRSYDVDYKAYSKEIINGLVIARSATDYTKLVFNGDTQTNTFTYGDTITVKIKPFAIGVALMSMDSEADQMALYYNDMQVSETVSSNIDGYYIMTIDTTLTMLPYGNITLSAKYVGNENMANHSEDITINLGKANSILTTPPEAILSLIYNTTEQTLVTAGSGAVGGILKYKLENGTYSEDLPKATDAGTHMVYYKVFGDENHNDTEEQNILVTIDEKTINNMITLASPVVNSVPQETISTEEYDASVVWSPTVLNSFAYSTVYTATITIVPKTNYTVIGVLENSYKVEDAQEVTNAANSNVIRVKYSQTSHRPLVGGGGGVATTYIITYQTNGGSEVKKNIVNRNAILKEPNIPTKDGYKFNGWYTDKGLTKAYDFTEKVTKSFTLYAKWTEKEVVKFKNPFGDININDWFYENVKYVVENNLMNGVSEDKFAPNNTLTRAMLVTVLYRNAGETAVNKSIPFADVDMGAWYANAVVWAKQNGIVNGVTENEFAPDSNITREQIAAIMFRYAQYKGMDAVTLEGNLHFADADEISEYAVSAMNWAIGTGLINGKSATTLNPLDNVTRVEAAAIFHRFIESYK